LCPILCALVRDYIAGKFVGWKIVGSGGNTASNYEFNIVKICRNRVLKVEYHFTDGFNKPDRGIFPNGQATTGYGTARRLSKSEEEEWQTKRKVTDLSQVAPLQDCDCHKSI
jgi:hypothetical protein